MPGGVRRCAWLVSCAVSLACSSTGDQGRDGGGGGGGTIVIDTFPICGNGIVELMESCDDRNNVSGDGCSSATCTIEVGWFCPLVGRPCAPLCGDGIITGGETC